VQRWQRDMSEVDPSATGQMVDRLRAGDPESFRELVLAYYNVAERFAYSLTRSRETAADVTQDVFGRVWELRERLDPAKSIKTYLMTAIRNHALDTLKRAAAQQRLESRVAQEYAGVPENQVAASPEDEFLEALVATAKAEKAAILVRAIAALPERRRTVLALRFDQQLSFRAIGEILGISDKAAQQLVIRTVGELKRKLGV
jgi:RNA polymerase sigma factor (sigma-70 family)